MAAQRAGLTQALDGMWKPIADLVKADLIASPVWEWRDDNGLVEVRPAPVELAESSGVDPIYIAATRYIAADGSEFFGYCSPTESSGLDYTQPVALTKAGPLPLWAENGLNSVQVEALGAALEIGSSGLFPINLDCLVPVEGVYYNDVINAI